MLMMMVTYQVEVCGDTLVGSDKDNNLFFKTRTSSDVKGMISSIDRSTRQIDPLRNSKRQNIYVLTLAMVLVEQGRCG